MRSLRVSNSYVSIPIILILAGIRCNAQHHQTMIESGGQKQLPGTISGSVSPQSIPDSVAYLMFFKILSAADASPQSLDRQRAILRLAELSENDFYELKMVMESFRLSLTANISDIQLEEKRVGGPDKRILEGLFMKRDEIVADASARLETVMTPEGVRRLHDLIISEKRNMTVIVGPDMTADTN